ncbi:carbohydrate ABC transporter permease [Chelatococcus asaccharovorans]|uniref:carbohydrate ABC transporter permease n=1 Tax=Chelatococcus asaccharovorans TaxID=28210 RepID=UPI00224C7778|nr:carbohydrate ABC transporter permease [Chelatococcus asaccharovorans]CAH1656840.1 Multiple sugar transport system permease protein [Chelatococcus asaccharovorans]CAH1684971.1 Multiple sugar transport system permease protein [Chelatococcus asaccharovorans]
MDSRSSVTPLDRIVLAVAIALAVIPILVVIASSFKEGRDIFSYRPVIFFWPTLDNYASLGMRWGKFQLGLGNSAVVTLGSIALVLAVCLPAAYALSRLPRHGVGRSSSALLIIKMLPPLVVTVPLFPIFSSVGLDNSRVGLILVYAAFEVSLSVMILKTFIDAVPLEVEEAAFLDGCDRLQAFLRVIMPLIWPGIITVAIFVALFAWNDYMFGLILTTSRTVTAPVVLADMLSGIGEGTATWGEVFAAATLQMIPVLAFAWIVQRQMFFGALRGATKG